MIGSYHKGSKDYVPLYLVEVSFWHNNQKNAGIYVEGVTGCGGRASTVLSQSRNKFLPPYKKRYSYTMSTLLNRKQLQPDAIWIVQQKCYTISSSLCVPSGIG